MNRPDQASRTERSSSEEPALKGSVALLPGGGSGIGRATALALADRGAEVVVIGRRVEGLQGTAALRSGIRAVPGDVSNPSDAGRIVHSAAETAGRLDVLVNNAGAVMSTPLRELSAEVAQSLWATNVLGPSLLARFSLPHLERTRRGDRQCTEHLRPQTGAGHQPVRRHEGRAGAPDPKLGPRARPGRRPRQCSGPGTH